MGWHYTLIKICLPPQTWRYLHLLLPQWQAVSQKLHLKWLIPGDLNWPAPEICSSRWPKHFWFYWSFIRYPKEVRPHQGTHLSLSGNLIPNISEEWWRWTQTETPLLLPLPSRAAVALVFCGYVECIPWQQQRWKLKGLVKQPLGQSNPCWLRLKKLDPAGYQKMPRATGQHPRTKLINCKYPNTGCFI